MTETPDTTSIAEGLLRRLGSDAIPLVRGRAAECLRSGDVDGGDYWRDVVQKMEAIVARRREPVAASQALPPGSQPDSVLWQLMQLIEDYRHRAMLAERKADEPGGRGRDELFEISQEWRDLAVRAELLAEWALRVRPDVAAAPRAKPGQHRTRRRDST